MEALTLKRLKNNQPAKNGGSSTEPLNVKEGVRHD